MYQTGTLLSMTEQREVDADFDGRLISAALAVLEQQGLAGLTMTRVADRLGASRMTLHRRGVTREDVVGRLAALAAEEYRQAVWPALTSAESGAQRLQRALEATCEVADRYAQLLVGLYADDGGIFHDVESAEPAERAGAIATRRVFVEPLARLLRDGQQDGTLSCDDPDLAATVLFNQVGWTFLALRHGQRWPLDRAKPAVVTSALASVSPLRSAPPPASRPYGGGEA